MNTIAAIVDSNGKTIEWSESGQLRLYKKDGDSWNLNKCLPYDVSSNSSIVILRKYLSDSIESLGECSAIVSKEVSGQFYAIVEAHLYNVYELEGNIEDLLESVQKAEDTFHEEELIRLKQDENKFFPDVVDKFGNFTIDLKKLLQEDGTVSSKQILYPFLKEEEFESLEVVCDHVPKWFDRELEGMGYNFHVANRKDGTIAAAIFPKRNSK